MAQTSAAGRIALARMPQRVRYRPAGRDSLRARIEGKQNGASREVDFRYARESCPQGGMSRPQ